MVEYTAAQLADALKPFIVRWIPTASPVSSPSVGGSLLSHDISGVLHTGTISLSQAPWALPIDGSRSITGNLSVDPGVTVDGVDISAHAANVNAHHAQSHSLATTAGLGADHTVSGLTAGQVLRATGATTAAFAQLQHSDLGGVSADQHHAQQHNITGSDHIITASTLQVVGATATNTLGLITPSSNPGAATAILASSAAGELTLVRGIYTSGWTRTSATVYSYHDVAIYNDATSSGITGTMKIALPKSWSSTMIRIELTGYNYQTGGAWEAVIQGYTYPSTWANSASAEVRGTAPFSSVRLAHDGAVCCILLGDMNTDWSYPKIKVSHVLTGHSNITGWETGWTISMLASETGITVSATPAIYHAPPDYRTISAGNGFAAGSGGDLTANRTFTLGTPSALSATTTDAVTTNSHTHSIATAAAVTLTMATTNAVGSSASLARADHTHAITTSSNPGAAASILASTAAGALTLVDMTISSLTATRLVASDGSDKLVSTNLNSWIAGTANRVTVTDDGDGTVTLSAPQDIHTAATPTFAGLIAPYLRPAANSTTALQLQTQGGTAVLTVDTTNQRVGIGNTPAYKLDVTGDVRLTGTLYADGGILDLGTDYFQEGVTYLELKGAKPFYLNQTVQASGWSMSAGGALVSSSSLSAASLALTGAATVGGNLTVGTTVLQVNTAGTRVGINRAADSQFDLDVAGAIRGQYLVGKHAIQLAAATAVIHYDGPAPYTLDFTGSNASHVGEGATETGGVIYRPGRYGKAVQMGQATTNRCTNPSFETDTTTPAGWTGSGLTTTTTTIDTATALYGGKALKLVNSTSGQDAYYSMNIAGLSASTAYTVSVWVNCTAFTAGALSNRILLAYDTANGASAVYAPLEATTAGWMRVQVTVTMTATPGNLQVRLYAPQATVFFDGVQVEQFAYATPYCDGSLGQGHSWSGTAHASTSSRTATKLEYPIRMVNPQAGTIMMWVKVDGYNGIGGGLWGWGSANGTMDTYFNSAGTMVSRVGGSQVSSIPGFAAGVWRHLAWTWDAAANKYRVFVDGVQQGSDYAYAAQAVHATALAVGGNAALSSTYTHNGLIDEFVLLDYAADPKLIRAIYESDAPVFVESSVFHWRSPSKVPIWVDEFGLWARGVSGGAILGLYGGDPRTAGATTSWGGITMEENDIVIGRTSAPSYTALHWDDSAGELILGRQAAEHVSLVSGSVRIKNATTVYADLSGSTFVLGNVAEENLRLTTSGIEFRNATEVQGSLSGTTWLLGKTGASENNVQITTSAISLRRGTTVYATLTGTDFQLGNNENVYVTPSAIQLRNGTTVNAQLDGDTLTLGQTTGTHTLITSTSLQLKSATTVYADLTGSTLVLGNVAEENLRLTTSGIEFRNATEVQGSLSATTWTLGKTTGNHVLITATSLDIKYGSTAKISLDASGNASFTGAITATSGSVTGTFSVGGFGKITAGDVVLDSSGLAIGVGSGYNPENQIAFLNGTTMNVAFRAFQNTTNINAYLLNNVSDTGTMAPLTAGKFSLITIAASASGLNEQADITLKVRTENGTSKTPSLSINSFNGASSTITMSADSIWMVGTTRVQGDLFVNVGGYDKTVWHSGNDGHGSTLDADTLDTYEATAFGRLAATQTWSALQTFSAGLTVSSGTTTLSGAASLGSTLTVAGLTTFNGNVTFEAGKTLTVGTGATSLGGTLGVTGAATMSSTLSVTGLITATGGVNASAQYQRAGTAGTIFVPLYVDALTDSGSAVWNGSINKTAATYTFDMQAAANGSVPAAAKAIVLYLSANWASASQSYYAIARKRGSSEAPLAIRAAVASINIDRVGIVPLDATYGDIDILVANATANAVVARLIGYFI